jgi:3-hydroxybutyryl-CoA dehydrogenase
VDLTDELVAKGRKRIEATLDRLVMSYAASSGKRGVSPEERGRILERLGTSTRLEDVLKTDVVLEAVPEVPGLKIELFRKLNEMGFQKLLLTNTSSIPITRLAGCVRKPERFMGMHFMNPASVQKGCELIRGFLTSEETVQTVTEFCRELGKEPILAEDGPGFGINRMLIPFLTEAIRVVEEGTMTCEDADKITLCAGHAMGPITTVDYVGLDTALAISTLLSEELGPRYRPPNLLKQLVRSGCLGMKSGAGFYLWQDEKKVGVNPSVARYRRR